MKQIQISDRKYNAIIILSCTFVGKELIFIVELSTKMLLPLTAIISEFVKKFDQTYLNIFVYNFCQVNNTYNYHTLKLTRRT
jgi:hypothetical protein